MFVGCLMLPMAVAIVGPVGAQDRFALVIGNSQYDVGRLRNPGNDADAVEAALKSLDFTVIKRKDVDRQQFEEAVREFRKVLTKQSVALFFFAGHGFQVQGENYLVPIGTKLEEEYDVKYKCTPVGYVLAALQESESNLKVIVLDCCRDNPFQRSWTRSANAQGLAPIQDVPQGTVIAFATASGKVSADGDGENSPYTSHLCQVLQSRPPQGLELVYVFRKASQGVKQDTGQTPWLHMEGSLPDYYLRAPDAKPPVMRPAPPAAPVLEPQITNSIGMQLKLIPAGEFLMGSPDGEAKRENDEGPQHRVRITKPFYLGVYEVTQGQYKVVMGRHPSTNEDADLPVPVSWDEAAEFCRKLSARESQTYRLPTEAEWEYACRAGTTTPFAFGSTILAQRDANFPDGDYTYGSGVTYRLGGPASVGSYRANRWGLYDMHGNVREWCGDWYDEGYYAKSPWNDPPGPATGLDRVIRGGYYDIYAGGCRSACRGRSDTYSRRNGNGFRVALVPTK